MSELSNELAIKLLAGQARHAEKLESVERRTLEIKTHLLGNGREGLVVKVDRLEQKDRFKSKFMWLIFGSIITLISSLLYFHITSQI